MANQNIYGGDELLDKYSKPTNNDTATDDNVVDNQWEAYTRARDAGHLDWVEEARQYDEYYYGKQWEDDIVTTLESEGRPYHTVNLVLSTVNAIIGEYIKSRQDISFAPMGKGANQDAAKSLRFLFKQIATNNNSEHLEKMMFSDGLIQDRGYMYYYLDFSDNLDGEVREEVIDPTDIILDPGAKDYDPRTWNEVYISRWMTPDEIGALYGPEYREKVSLAAANGTFGHDSLEWEAPNFSGQHYNSESFFQAEGEEVKRVKRVRVIERQYRKLARTAFFVDQEKGDMRRVPEGWDAEKIKAFAQINELGLMWKPERRIRVTITADKCLLHDKWSLFDQISIIPFFPYFRRGRPFGVVRNLVSIQDMLNKVSSQELHVVNTTANSGWVFRQGSLVNMDADDLRTQGSKSGLVLEIAQGYDEPQKIQPNQIPTGLSEISSKAGIYFREVSGVNEAQLGLGRSDSSKALESRRRGGLIQQEIIFDNLEYTRKLRADIMLEAVQRYYTETRLITVLEKNEDGDDVEQEVAINQPVMAWDQDAQEAVEMIRNDLTLGEYSTVISTVPRRDTYEEALFDQLMQMREAGVRLPDYVLVEASQLPDKKEVVEVIKRMEGLAAPTPEEIQRQQQLAELEMRMLTAEVTEKEAHAMERQAKAQQLQAQAGAELQKPEVEKLRIGTDARVEMEKMGMQYKTNQEDLMTRIRIAQGKEGTMRDIAKVESMTRRNEAGMKRASDLQKTLMDVREKARERAAGQAEKAKAARAKDKA
jgi:hypothetical protein